MFKTQNGGSSWARQTSNTKRTLRSVSAANLVSTCAVGAKGAILITTEEGKTLKKQLYKDKKDLVGVTMVQSR